MRIRVVSRNIVEPMNANLKIVRPTLPLLQFMIMPKTKIFMIIISPVIALDCAFAHPVTGRKLLASGTLIVNDRLNTANRAKV